MLEKILLALLIVSCLTLIYALFEPYWLKVKRYKINSAPNSFKGKKIVFLTDIHNSQISPVRNLDSIIKIVNNLKPDIIILGGDYVSDNKKYVKPLFDKLVNLKAKSGIFGVLGNHDFEVGSEYVKYFMEKAGITVLENAISKINFNNEPLIIAGISDYLLGKPDLDKVINQLNNQYSILVSHNPDIVDDLKSNAFDLVISGHTHGGQITVFGLYAPIIPSRYRQKYRTGLIKTQHTKLIVSNGIGCIGLPLRFFARPQIVVIEL